MALMDTIKKLATAEADVVPKPKDSKEPEEQTPYIGFHTNKNGEVIGRAPSLSHVAILGGPGSGKTVALLVPQICTWDGPVFAVSAKSDLAEYSANIRARRGGPIYMMDLTGQADWSKLPEGVTPVANDPTALLVPDADGSTEDAAMDMATLLTQVGTLGMGGGKGGGGDSAFWMTLSLGVLACLLQSGHGYYHPETGEWVRGGGIEWVMQAYLNMGDDEDADSDELDLDTPTWDVAATRAGLVGSAHADEIGAAKDLDPKQRDSIAINLRVALSSWKKRSVRGTGGKPFSPEIHEDPNATIYHVSPSHGAAAGAATSIVESIVEHWTKNSIVKGLPRVSMVIDECPQICPIPRLREHIGLMRSYGCWFTVAAQESSQFTARFGRDEMEALIRVFPTIVVMVGAIEDDLLNRAAWTVRATERRVESTDHAGRLPSTVRSRRRCTTRSSTRGPWVRCWASSSGPWSPWPASSSAR